MDSRRVGTIAAVALLVGFGLAAALVLAEPYRTPVILRDIEDLSYEEIAEVMQVSLGTVKSRLVRGREALKKRLESYIRESGAELGIEPASLPEKRREAAGAEAGRGKVRHAVRMPSEVAS